MVLATMKLHWTLAGIAAVVFAVLLLGGRAAGAAGEPAAAAAGNGEITHVFIIVLENKGFDETFGPFSHAPYLSKTLRDQGALLEHYYGTGHDSLDNYLSMVSGMAPNIETMSDCEIFSDFVMSGMSTDGQPIGHGCVYPKSILTIANQLEASGRSWKAYMEDMGNDLKRDGAATCAHPTIGTRDETQHAQAPSPSVPQGDQYAARHNPFVYFHSIIDSSDCGAHIVNLTELRQDLKSVGTTPNYAFITPNLCHDAHDGGVEGRTCVNGEPGGLVSADRFLQALVPDILGSPAFKQGGLLIVTFDEADLDLASGDVTGELVDDQGDARACCNEQPGPNLLEEGRLVFGVPVRGPGIVGPGGGRVGAVLVSPFIKPGTVSREPYNHYSLLRSIEDLFGLSHLGYAGQAGLKSFGSDVFTLRSPRGSRLENQ